jgi:hypothetical protein
MDSSSLLPPVTLPILAILIGAVLFGTHLFGWFLPEFSITTARAFPRSRIFGTLLLGISALWTFVLVATTDLGEFSSMRNLILIAITVGACLFWKFVPDFLSSRSLGFLLLLAAGPVLTITFLKSGLLHFTLVFLAYCWALTGLFLVGMPYLHRDLIGWICEKRDRWNLACIAGIFFGLFLLVEGLREQFL